MLHLFGIVLNQIEISYTSHKHSQRFDNQLSHSQLKQLLIHSLKAV